MQDLPDDEFSFKGIAPDDRKGEAAGAEVDAPPPALPRVLSVDPLAETLVASEASAVGVSAAGESFPLQASAGQPEGQTGPPEFAAGGHAPGPPGFAAQATPATPVAAPPADASEAPHAIAPKKPRVTVNYEGDRPASSASTLSPRHLVQKWLKNMVDAQASDLILRSGGRPSQRLDGRITFLPGEVPGPGPMLEVLRGILGERRMETFEETGSADAALDLDGLGRFRINAYKQMGEPAIVIRRINEDAPSLDDLHLPADELKHLALRKRGLVLVTGVAGSGKSTTLSAMIEFMNRNVERHIVTLEDPVELLFKERYCVISQREVGTDTLSFKQGLKHALRQSPDVILIGEMRDAETVLAALEAIETGHLVMSTMHTVNAAQTVDRILGFFPAERHVQIRQRMADTLAGVLSMRLVPRKGGGLVPAYELMQVTPQVRELLEEGKTTELGRVIQGGMEKGIVAFNDRLRDLVQSGMVELEDAVQTSDRPDELLMMMRGIQGGTRATAKAAAANAADAGQGTPQRRRSDHMYGGEAAGGSGPDAGQAGQAGQGNGPGGKGPGDGPGMTGGGSGLRLRGGNGY